MDIFSYHIQFLIILKHYKILSHFFILWAKNAFDEDSEWLNWILESVFNSNKKKLKSFKISNNNSRLREISILLN